jgi:hypothetical protein
VAHDGEERRFRLVGRLGLVTRVFQLVLALPLLRHVGQHRHQPAVAGAPVAQVRPGVVVRLDRDIRRAGPEQLHQPAHGIVILLRPRQAVPGRQVVAEAVLELLARRGCPRHVVHELPKGGVAHHQALVGVVQHERLGQGFDRVQQGPAHARRLGAGRLRCIAGARQLALAALGVGQVRDQGDNATFTCHHLRLAHPAAARGRHLALAETGAMVRHFLGEPGLVVRWLAGFGRRHGPQHVVISRAGP